MIKKKKDFYFYFLDKRFLCFVWLCYIKIFYVLVGGRVVNFYIKVDEIYINNK